VKNCLLPSNMKNIDPRYNDLPKTEIHIHLEDSIRTGTIIDIAREYDLKLPAYEVAVRRGWAGSRRERGRGKYINPKESNRQTTGDHAHKDQNKRHEPKVRSRVDLGFLRID